MKVLAAISILGGLVAGVAGGTATAPIYAATAIAPHRSVYPSSPPLRHPVLPPQYSSRSFSAPVEGIAEFYARGLMQRVAANRGMKLMPIGFDPEGRLLGKYLPDPDMSYVQGYAAASDRSDASLLGRVIWASINGEPWQRFQVVDVSQPRHVATHRRQGLLIEVDYESAARCRMVRTGWAPTSVIYPKGLERH